MNRCTIKTDVTETEDHRSMPIRIQLSRKAGWRMPENTVKVDWTTRWGNPFKAIDPKSRSAVIDAIAYFRKWLEGGTDFMCGPGSGVTMARIPHWTEPSHLRIGIPKLLCGKNLACWCKIGSPCHADVLLELANREEAQ